MLVHIKRAKKHLELQNWILHGATKVGDVIDNNGKYYNYEEFSDKFPRLNANRKDFSQVIVSIKAYQNKTNINFGQQDRRNETPKFWQIILSGGSKVVYNLLKRPSKKAKSINKWEVIFKEQVEWKNIFTKAIKMTTDPQLK